MSSNLNLCWRRGERSGGRSPGKSPLVQRLIYFYEFWSEPKLKKRGTHRRPEPRKVPAGSKVEIFLWALIWTWVEEEGNAAEVGAHESVHRWQQNKGSIVEGAAGCHEESSKVEHIFMSSNLNLSWRRWGWSGGRSPGKSPLVQRLKYFYEF